MVYTREVTPLLDPFTKKRVEKIMSEYVEQKVPKQVRDQVKLNYKFRGDHVTLFQERPAFKSDQWVQLEVAQFRMEQNRWSVHWKDSKGKWHFVEDIVPDENFEKQLKIVDEDQRGLFWS
ncbi:DUF3024 domain-containing protein [Paenibacillus ginsengarvi]|uniref:DUF3024 domain-containing protein n=1 Tax=Paenibacillus ginsengarvi TaxID=400777 RepID=A0A3B0BHI1_9BACL|nr:DUF3024 domain-containing protein [Paenibacillus ginsengarvi]